MAEHVIEECGEVMVNDVARVPQEREDSSVGGVAAPADHHHLRVGHA